MEKCIQSREENALATLYHNTEIIEEAKIFKQQLNPQFHGSIHEQQPC